MWDIYDSVRINGGHVTGLWTDEQERCWSVVVDAVTTGGARFRASFCMPAASLNRESPGTHWWLTLGCLCRPCPHRPNRCPPMRKPATTAGTTRQPYPVPWKSSEIGRVVEDYRVAAARAARAGFDAVEIHGAHGYLIDQFLCDGVNQRADRYGGSTENRCRFLFEVVDAVVAEVGDGRVGVRLSPLISQGDPAFGHAFFGATCTDPEVTYGYAVSGLNERPLAYLLLTEPRVGGLLGGPDDVLPPLRNSRYREIYGGALIGAGGFSPASAALAGESGAYDAIAFGRWFLANPDLVDRIAQGLPLNVYDRSTFYGLGPDGARIPGT
ncbi:MAG: alkene reductase [Acidimicrobiales bacterium]|nr:MAG: alkene reductase [Acidimicrobiales bacterium]